MAKKFFLARPPGGFGLEPLFIASKNVAARVDPGMRVIAILPDGKFISGMDLFLSKNNTGTVSGLPREEHHEKMTSSKTSFSGPVLTPP